MFLTCYLRQMMSQVAYVFSSIEWFLCNSYFCFARTSLPWTGQFFHGCKSEMIYPLVSLFLANVLVVFWCGRHSGRVGGCFHHWQLHQPTRFRHPGDDTYKKEYLELGKKYFSVASERERAGGDVPCIRTTWDPARPPTCSGSQS